MKFVLTVRAPVQSIRVTERGERTRRYLLTADTDRILAAEGEAARDVVLEILAKTSGNAGLVPPAGADITKRILTVCEHGYATPKSLALAGALEATLLPATMTPSSDTPVLRFDLVAGTVTLEDGAQLSLGQFFTTPEDRQNEGRRNAGHEPDAPAGPAWHPFASRYDDAPDSGIALPRDQPCRPAEHDTGSLMAGVFDALIGTPYGRITDRHALLAGGVAGACGRLSADPVEPRAARGGAIGARQIRDRLVRCGAVGSDRGWAPRAYTAEAHFAEVRAAAGPALFALGRALGPVLARLDADAAELALSAFLARLGEDPNQYGFRDRHRQRASHHELMAAERVIADLAEIAGATLPAREAG